MAKDPLSGSSEIYKIDWEYIVIESFDKTNDYNIEELKVGNYVFVGDLKNFKIKTSKKEVVKQELLKDVILKDVEIIKTIVENGKTYVKARGTIFAKTPFVSDLKVTQKINQNDPKVVEKTKIDKKTDTVVKTNESKNENSGEKQK